MAASAKVDAKIELIRVKIQAEVERLEDLNKSENGGGNEKLARSARANGLRYALNMISDVEARVK